MVLWPAVKEFIENNIKSIEKSDLDAVFAESIEWLNDVEFNQLYSILQELPIEYDLDEAIDELIQSICKAIIKENDGDYICIEDEWSRRAYNHLGKPDNIIYEFDDFECDIKNGKHWCTVYEY